MRKCLVLLLLLPTFAMQSWANTYSIYTENFEFTNSTCSSLQSSENLIHDYIKLWGANNSDVPVAPDQEQEFDKLVIQFQNIKSCLFKYSFENKENYEETLRKLNERFQKTKRENKNSPALISLISELDIQWASRTLNSRLLRDEGKVTRNILYSLGTGVMLAGAIMAKKGTGFKDLFKTTRFGKLILKRVSPAKLGHALLTAGSKPASVRAGYIGYGGGSTAKKSNNRLKELEEKGENLDHDISTDIDHAEDNAEVWHSPIYYMRELGADHSANEMIRFDTYDSYRSMGAILTGTVFGFYSHFQLNKVINKFFPVRELVKSFFRPKGAIGNGAKVARGVNIAAGVGEFAVGMGIGIGLYKLGDLVTRKVSDSLWESRMMKKYIKHKKDLESVEGEYWENYLESEIGVGESPYAPVLGNTNNNIDFDLKISMGLFNKLNYFKHVVKQRADYYLGHSEKREREIVEAFVENYLCTGVRYQKYYYDLIDKNNGKSLPNVSVFVSPKRAMELYEEGVEQLVELEKKFKKDISEIENEFAHSYEVKRSQQIYQNSIEFLEGIQEKSGRYFVKSTIDDLKAAKNNEIYLENPDVIYQHISHMSGALLTEILEDSETRAESSCLKSTYQDLKEEYWNK